MTGLVKKGQINQVNFQHSLQVDDVRIHHLQTSHKMPGACRESRRSSTPSRTATTTERTSSASASRSTCSTPSEAPLSPKITCYLLLGQRRLIHPVHQSQIFSVLPVPNHSLPPTHPSRRPVQQDRMAGSRRYMGSLRLALFHPAQMLAPTGRNTRRRNHISARELHCLTETGAIFS